jgi:hypothetical protein
MNLNVVTAIGTVIGVAISLWTIMSNFDKRNSDRFDGLPKQIESVKETLCAEFKGEVGTLRGEVGTLRAEMREMRAELRLEIRDAADRRVR